MISTVPPRESPAVKGKTIVPSQQVLLSISNFLGGGGEEQCIESPVSILQYGILLFFRLTVPHSVRCRREYEGSKIGGELVCERDSCISNHSISYQKETSKELCARRDLYLLGGRRLSRSRRWRRPCQREKEKKRKTQRVRSTGSLLVTGTASIWGGGVQMYSSTVFYY